MRRRRRAGHGVYAVILAGGKGKRLRPYSTPARPKAFMAVTRDGKTMFAKTLERIQGIFPPEHVIVVANRAHARLVKKDFPRIAKGNLLLEPVSRNTAPAVALAAFALKRRVGDAVMAVLPVDHDVEDARPYRAALEEGISFVEGHPASIVTMGVAPRWPATGFGYIRLGRRGAGPGNVYPAAAFVEKPSVRRARGFVRSGRYLWNAGSFIFRAGHILKEYARHAPRIFRGLSEGYRGGVVTERCYRALPDVSIDYAIMEKAGGVRCVRGRYRWQDMGSVDALKDVLAREGRRFIAVGRRRVAVA